MKPAVSLEMIPAKKEDKERVLAFLQRNFFPDEPLNNALNRMPKSERECLSLMGLTEGHSYLAVNTLMNNEVSTSAILTERALCSFTASCGVKSIARKTFRIKFWSVKKIYPARPAFEDF